ncbi:nucleotidyl transferase AbiEii/AbiGii toxin family protein [Klebsiella sp. Q11]
MDLRDSYARQVRLLMTALPHVAKESCFALKGGTAINLFVQDFPRLSVDIDLAYKTFTDRDTDLAVINDALMRITESLNGRPGITAIRQENKADEKRIIVNTADAKIKIEVCHAVKCGPRIIMCGVPSAICEPQTVMCGPDSTHNEASLLKHRFFVIPLTKPKRFYVGAFMGVLFASNINKTNNKQHVNRRYDSESGHHYLKNPPKRRVFAFLRPDSPSNCVRLFAAQQS